MKKVRIEIHLEKEETKVLDKAAKDVGRSRKNFCENKILEAINCNNPETPCSPFKKIKKI